MTRTLYLAWRYLSYHRVKTAILVGSITLIVFLPVGLRVLVKQSSEQLTARAVATPLVVGAKGSPLELVLNTLYFGSDSPELLRYREVQRVEESGLARAIPMDVRFNARGHPIVGTTLDYFAFRDTRVAGGRLFAILGECVVGARVAEALEVGPGDDVISSPESVFDLAGVYPLKMRIAGVLEFSDSADDDAIFVDVKTSWVIEGRVHGHQDLAAPEAARGVLSRDGNRVTANASVVQYNEITPDKVLGPASGSLRGSRGDGADRATRHRDGRSARHDPDGRDLRDRRCGHRGHRHARLGIPGIHAVVEIETPRDRDAV
jgi:putative ABC transport system permease protein